MVFPLRPPSSSSLFILPHLFGVSLVGVSLAAYSTSNRDRLGDGGTDDEGVGGGDVVEANLRGGVVGRLEDIREVLFRGSNSCVNN